MRYELYTTVDITSTGQFRFSDDKSSLQYKKEQNFQTVLQTIGIRGNISYKKTPVMSEVRGDVLGFSTNKIIKVWNFEFETERDFLFENNNNPVGYLLDDFNGVPYLAGLDELVEQNYEVFVTEGPAKNIVFLQI